MTFFARNVKSIIKPKTLDQNIALHLAEFHLIEEKIGKNK